MAFIGHRREVVVKRILYELKKAKEKLHLLEGFKMAVENIDEVVSLIKSAENATTARERLMESYSLSAKQSQAILEMRLQRLTGLEREKIINDYNKTKEEIARLEEILGSQKLIRKVIKEEFDDILDRYNDERKTAIVSKASEIFIEDLIKERRKYRDHYPQRIYKKNAGRYL